MNHLAPQLTRHSSNSQDWTFKNQVGWDIIYINKVFHSSTRFAEYIVVKPPLQMQYRILSHTYTPANFLYAYFAMKLPYLLTFSAPDNHFFDFCYYELDFFPQIFFQKQLYNVYHLGPGFLHSASCLGTHSCVSCVSSNFLLLLGSIPLSGYTTICFSVYTAVRHWVI